MEKSNKKILIAIVAVVVIAVVAVVLFVALKPSYKSQIKAFGKAMTDSEKMEEFVEKKVNLRALYAIEKLEEHDDLDTGDEDAVKKAFEEEYKKAKKSDYEGKEFVDDSLNILEEPVLIDSYSVIVDKSNKDLLKTINKVIKRMKKNGDIDKSLLKHSGD